MIKQTILFFLFLLGINSLASNSLKYNDYLPKNQSSMEIMPPYNNFYKALNHQVVYSPNSKNTYFISGTEGFFTNIKYTNDNLSSAVFLENSDLKGIDSLYVASGKLFALNFGGSSIQIFDDSSTPSSPSKMITRGLLPWMNKIQIISTPNPDIAKLYAYYNNDPGKIQVYNLNINDENAVLIETINLSNLGHFVDNMAYNAETGNIELLINVLTGSKWIEEIDTTSNPETSVRIGRGYGYATALFSYGNMIFAYGGDTGIYVGEKTTEDIPPKHICTDLGIISSIDMFDNKIIIGTHSNSLWYLPELNSKYAERFVTLWRSTNLAYPLTPNDFIYNIPKNSNYSDKLYLNLLPSYDLTSPATALYRSTNSLPPIPPSKNGQMTIIIVAISTIIALLLMVLFIIFFIRNINFKTKNIK